MKKLIAFGFGSCLSSFALATPALPKAPDGCLASIKDKGYCSDTIIPASSFPLTLRFFVVVEKSNYPTVENLLDKYLAFDQWPAYAATVESDVIIYNKSVRMSNAFNANNEVIARHYYDYKLKSPIGYQKVRGVTHNVRLAQPYAGSEGTIEFAAQNNGPQEVPAGEKPLNGSEGVKYQSGIINTVDCSSNNNQGLCANGQWLLIYETSVTPAINLLPKVAATSVEKGLETVLVGMLFNSVP